MTGTGAGAAERQPVALPGAADGRGIILSSWIGTLALAATAAVAAFVTAARLPAVIIDLALFFGGSGVFLWALAAAAGRSREREISVWSLFLLEQAAPPRVRRALLGALGVQSAVAIGTAWITPALAFGCLAPMWALGHSGLWAARYGAFGPKPPRPSRTPKPSRTPRTPGPAKTTAAGPKGPIGRPALPSSESASRPGPQAASRRGGRPKGDRPTRRPG